MASLWETGDDGRQHDPHHLPAGLLRCLRRVVKIAADGTVNVVGDPAHSVSRGALCGKCSIGYNGVWRDPSVRLTRPLKRVGPKGAGRSSRSSGTRRLPISPIVSTRSAATTVRPQFLQTHYTGTCSLIAGTFPLRFFNSIGATEVDPDTVCNKAGHVALQLMYGESTRGFDPRTIDGSHCVMIWGANPSTSAPHVHQYWLSETPVPRSSSILFATRRRRRPTCICSFTPAPTARSLSRCCMSSGRRAASIGPSWPRTPKVGRRSKLNWMRALRPGVKQPPACRRASSRTLRFFTRKDHRCCGWVRASSANPSAAMPCAQSRPCRQQPATSADTAPVSSISTAGTREASMRAI